MTILTTITIFLLLGSATDGRVGNLNLAKNVTVLTLTLITVFDVPERRLMGELETSTWRGGGGNLKEGVQYSRGSYSGGSQLVLYLKRFESGAI